MRQKTQIVDWKRARIARVSKVLNKGRPHITIELELESGKTVLDSFPLGSVYTECHQKHLWKILGGPPLVGQVVELQLDMYGKKPKYKGYRRAQRHALL